MTGLTVGQDTWQGSEWGRIHDRAQSGVGYMTGLTVGQDTWQGSQWGRIHDRAHSGVGYMTTCCKKYKDTKWCLYSARSRWPSNYVIHIFWNHHLSCQNGVTALQLAAFSKHPKVVSVLIQAEARLDTTNQVTSEVCWIYAWIGMYHNEVQCTQVYSLSKVYFFVRDGERRGGGGRWDWVGEWISGCGGDVRKQVWSLISDQQIFVNQLITHSLLNVVCLT